MIQRLHGWADSPVNGKSVAVFLASAEGEQQTELFFLQGSRLVYLLGEIAARTARPDGWALLSIAGQLLKRDAPMELKDLPMRFGLPNLKGVMLASQLFDVVDEATVSGGSRLVYRINDRYELAVR